MSKTYRNYRCWAASALLACLGPAGAAAAPLACVQRAIDWNNASTFNSVAFAAVALHEIGEGAYATGYLVNSVCKFAYHGYPTLDPQPPVTLSCLIGNRAVNAQLLHRDGSANGVLSLSVAAVPSDTQGLAQLSQRYATYSFDPVCVGNLLTGSDQYGNRWTMSFTLLQNLPPR